MCAKAVRKDTYSLQFISDCIKKQEICAEVVRKEPNLSHFVPDL